MAQRYAVTCKQCKEVKILEIHPDDLQEWKDGELIQNAMPYLSADEREILISGICGNCFDSMFGE